MIRSVALNDLIGEFGLYHLWFCCLIFMSRFFVSFHHFAIVFLTPQATWVCPNKAKCCSNPKFDKSFFRKTIITKWKLICDKEWMKIFAQLFFNIGNILGSVVLGIISDEFGRCPTLIMAVVIELVFGIISTFVPNYWVFSFLRLIIGFGVGGLMTVAYVLLMEYIGYKYRYIISTLFHLPFSIGTIMMSFIGYYTRDFDVFLLTIAFSNSVMLVYICCLPESILWLFSQNRTEDAVQSIRVIAAKNNVKLDALFEEKLAIFEKSKSLEQQSVKESLFNLFRSHRLRLVLFSVSSVWFSCSYYLNVVMQYIGYTSKGLTIFTNLIILGILSSVGVLLTIPAMKFCKRKNVLLLSSIGCASCILIAQLLPDGLPTTIMVSFGMLFIYIVYLTIYAQSSEIFPTVVRNSAVGITSMFGRFGAMTASIVSMYVARNKWLLSVLGILPIISATLGYCYLPETLDCELPTTIKELEELCQKGSSRKSSTVPTTIQNKGTVVHINNTVTKF